MSAKRAPTVLPIASGLCVVVLWASAFPAIRAASPELGVIGLSLVRLLVAAVALLALAPFLKVRLPARRDLPLIIACAFFGMTAYQLLLNWGELYVPAGTASIIVASAPLVSVGIAAYFFKERLSGIKIAGSVVAIAGVVLVCLARTGVSLSVAVWIVVAAMVVQGIYHPLTKPLLRRYTGMEVATYGMVFGTVMTAPFVPWGIASIFSAGAPAWVAAIYLGLFPSALGFVLWGYAVARLNVAASTSLLYLVPPVAVAISFFWLGEIPVAGELAGGAVVIVGVVWLSQGERLMARLKAMPMK